MGVYRHNNRESTSLQGDDGNIAILTERSAKGDFEAYGELYSIFLNRIYRYVFYYAKDKMTAEDLTEEIFMKAWKSIRTYRGNGRPFSSWLYRIAHNHVIDSFRTNGKSRRLSLETPASGDPVVEAERHTLQRSILELISHLPAPQQQVTILKFIEGLDNREIGEITGKSQGAVRAIQMRALTALREKMKDEEVGRWILSYQAP